ncbi:hypothetical protein F4680DRAFT_404417 [Xylaria scruposa]|nr:hypothetical protein F4680DRAFT_404417 [Xylaria scruposa]
MPVHMYVEVYAVVAIVALTYILQHASSVVSQVWGSCNEPGQCGCFCLCCTRRYFYTGRKRLRLRAITSGGEQCWRDCGWGSLFNSGSFSE